ncbi:MAG: hypothetical protein LBQ51_04730 [Desulfovibrio sp.]|jgi:hypothetical protein|nr:hypothetical protein [Desulfovibrio sp.]
MTRDPRYLPPPRRCADCGRPTNNYRCPRCWTKRRGYAVAEDVEVDAYRLCGQTIPADVKASLPAGINA